MPNDRSRLPLARNAVRKMRTLRHPGVIKVLDTVETENYIYVATERVLPLSASARGNTLNEETSKWGLYAVANTLAFINDEASSVHGAVRLSSIFTSKSGEWRLGGFEILSSLKDDEAIIYHHGTSIPGSRTYSTPEIAKSGWETIKRNPLPVTDAYGFGILIFEAFNGCSIASDQVGLTKNVPSSMQPSYKRLCNANPKARLSISHFRDQGKRSGGFFGSTLIKLSDGIESLGLKSEGERTAFMQELDEVADDFPDDFLSVKVLPELLKSVEFGGGGPEVFTSVIKIGKKLSGEQWDSRIMPVIVRLFANPDRAIRVCLLDNLPQMIDHLSQKTVNDKIFPQMVTGFTDVAPLVREQTVKAILTVISKLADRTVNGELLKHLAKTSNDEQPGIRTNTTICMGKIARNLGTNTRQKVLIAAFTRSLRDPFVHARHAGLLALASTADLFSEEDCAIKILPALCSPLIDKEKLVRDQANKAFEIYLQRIRKYSATLPETLLPPATVAASGVMSRTDTPSQDSIGWAGWSISSFTNRLGSASGAMKTAAPVNANDNPASDQPSLSAAATLTSQRPQLAASATFANHQGSKKESGVLPSPASDKHSYLENAIEDEDVDEAWGDFADDTFMNATPGSQPLHGSKRSPPVSYDDGGEPDFEGWLKAQTLSKSKSKGPLPKGLSKTPARAKTTAATPPISTSGNANQRLGTKGRAGDSPKQKPGPAKAIAVQPMEAEDDWGDAWD